MADFYDEMAQMAAEVLAPTSAGGLGQGTVVLRRTVTSDPPADAPWEGGTETTTDYTLKAVVDRVHKRFVDGTLIVGTEDQITFAAVDGLIPGMTDTFLVDGRERVLKDLRPEPAAGTVSVWIAFVEA